MPEVIKFSKGTVAEHNNFTGENGEITLICDDSPNRKVTGIIRLHDGQTVGGVPFGGSQLLNDLHDVNTASATLGTVLTAGANDTFYFNSVVTNLAGLTDVISANTAANGTILTADGNGGFKFDTIAKGGGDNQVFFENDTTITDDYTISAGKNAMTAGPITIANNATVVIPVGSTWTIV